MNVAKIPARIADSNGLEVAEAGRDFEADAVQGNGPITAPLSPRSLLCKGQTQGIGGRTITANAGGFEETFQRRLAGLGNGFGDDIPIRSMPGSPR